VQTWFTRILINAANDIYKRQKRECSINALDDVAFRDDYGDMRFFELIKTLPPELREIISLKYYSDYTLAEIALVLNIPDGTVKSRLNRALKLLRLEVEDG
jgi:RNA polymerase sigma-70 factor (ECF subfamily)